jgi:uncharacterized protein with von Willebrand factor type A (vWA) domain
VEPRQSAGDGQPGAHRLEARAILDLEEHALAALAGEGTARRGERGGREAHARQALIGERRGEARAVDPGRAHLLERA